MAPLENVTKPPSLKELAFQAIRKAILTGHLEAGKMYNEQNLAKEMGISKTPIREALLDLAAKGFVVFLPRKGIKISRLTLKQIGDLLSFRKVLEGAIVHTITPCLTDNDLLKIESIHTREIEAADRLDRLGLLERNREFHIFLATLTGNQYIVSALENVYDLIDWTVSKALLFDEVMPTYFDHHKKVVEMLKKRDPYGAHSVIEEHIALVARMVGEWFRNNEKEEQAAEDS